MATLEAMLDAQRASTGHLHANDVRAAQIGSGMRGDKRRTYRFRDDAIEDHETGKRTTCKKFMRGDIEELWVVKAKRLN
jgi:protein subunit release factor A